MGDFGSATEAMRIIDLFALQVFANNLDRCNFRLCNTIPLKADIRASGQHVRFGPGAVIRDVLAYPE
jgi:hypothetical protein